MLSEFVVGPRVVSDGTDNPGRSGKAGEIITADLHGRYAEACYRQNLFVAFAIVTTPVAYSTAAGIGGPLIWNGSTTKIANILGVGWGLSTGTAVPAGIGLTGGTGQTSAPTTTTATDGSRNLYLGGAAPACTAYRIGTVTVAGNFLMTLGDIHSGALTTDTTHMNWVDVAGSMMVPPNSWCSVAATTAITSAVMNATIVWEELPL